MMKTAKVNICSLGQGRRCGTGGWSFYRRIKGNRVFWCPGSEVKHFAYKMKIISRRLVVVLTGVRQTLLIVTNVRKDEVENPAWLLIHVHLRQHVAGGIQNL